MRASESGISCTPSLFSSGIRCPRKVRKRCYLKLIEEMLSNKCKVLSSSPSTPFPSTPKKTCKVSKNYLFLPEVAEDALGGNSGALCSTFWHLEIVAQRALPYTGTSVLKSEAQLFTGFSA
jgi:hypothetical protein